MAQSIFRIAADGEQNTQKLRHDFTAQFADAGGPKGGAKLCSMSDDLHVPAGDRVVAVKIKGEPTAKQAALLDRMAYNTRAI